MPNTAVLPIARVTLRILIAANWVMGALILSLLAISFQQPEWTWKALGAAEIAARPGGVAGMRAIMAVGLIGVPIAALILGRLAQIVRTVRMREPFTAANAGRVQAIAWGLLGLQVLHVAVAAIAASIATDKTPLKLGGGGTITGWLAVLLLFVLAGVFREGAAMRDDLEGTV